MHALLAAIHKRENGQLPSPLQKHKQIAQLYNWGNIANRTELVYAEAIAQRRIGIGQYMKKYIF